MDYGRVIRDIYSRMMQLEIAPDYDETMSAVHSYIEFLENMKPENGEFPPGTANNCEFAIELLESLEISNNATRHAIGVINRIYNHIVDHSFYTQVTGCHW